ncbi:hypothetical protein QTO34_019719 [Cnephaeus nilssonii]|uniref:Uncharacterized protein n=1 Tax=Cnephaeus nilssonii TaxID=3371016 RepID=A0AA40LM95_CNENI|nr:hypothetical protein QTO34_019719 [Eptesicus nilssonii]
MGESATKLGKKCVKQFKNKQQGDKIPKNKFQQANKFNKKRELQLDSKSDESAAKKPKWDDFKKKKKELKQSRQLRDSTNYDIVVQAKQIWEISADHPTLDKVLEVQPETLELIMNEMKHILTPMAQKEAVMKHSLVHKVFLDFLTYAPPKLRSEMVEAICEVVV